MKDWKTWVLLIGIYLLVKMCGGCNGCNSGSSTDYSSDSYRQSSSDCDSERALSWRAPSWIQGTWTCVTPYVNMQVEIVGDHIREIPGDGSSYYGTYHIQGDAIMPETGSHIYYQMDFDRKRLSAGEGYYFRKQ